MEDINAQINEELTVTVPIDVDGPSRIEDWFTDEHVSTALFYYSDA